MWIVRLALRRPYTFVVAALLLLLMTPFVLTKTPTDIFPAINIPVVSVIWSYTGLPADQIAQRIVYSEERALTTTVDNIEHIESTSYDGFGVIKGFLSPGHEPVDRGGPIDRCFTNHFETAASRDHSAADHPIQRVHRSHSAVRD